MKVFAQEPELMLLQATKGAAGLDLRAATGATIEPGETKKIGTGIHVAIPWNAVGLVRGRSSLSSRGLFVLEGTIDSDYRGEISVMLFNASKWPATVERLSRIAQLVVVFNSVNFEPFDSVEGLGETERGHGGFGSTGR